MLPHTHLTQAVLLCLLEIAQSLRHLHSHGLVHCDLKVGGVLLLLHACTHSQACMLLLQHACTHTHTRKHVHMYIHTH